jgi:hypothetical protein
VLYRTWCRIALLLCLASLALPGLAAEPASRPRSVLQGVSALDKPVTYTETKIPLGELVQKVATDTGVKLTATQDVADEPVAVVVKELPARELLEQLADLLDYRWGRRIRRGAPSYEIWQDLKSKQREAALRDALLGAAEKELREQVRRAVEIAGLSQDEVMALRREEQERARELQRMPREQIEAFLRRPEEQEKTRRYQLTNYLWSPISRSLARLVGHLTAEQWSSLREDGQLRFSTDPRPGELPLPAEMERLFRSGPPGLLRPGDRVIFPEETGGEEGMRRREKEMQDRWSGAAGYRVTIQWNDQLKAGGPLHLGAEASPIDPGPPPPSYTISSGMMLTLDARPQDAPEAEPDPATPERRALWQQDPILSTPRPFDREPTPQSELLLRSAGSDSEPPIQALLPALARRYGVSFVADSYWAAPAAYDCPRAGEPIALFPLLDRLARPNHWWECCDEERASKRAPPGRRLIRLRSRTWFLDRPCEVPLRLVSRWRALLERDAALPLDEYRELSALRDEQLLSLNGLTARGVLPRELPDLQEVYAARYALRLYASLLPAQQEALAQGGDLAAAQMPPVQRVLFLKAAKESCRYRGAVPGPPEPGMARFSLTSERYVRVEEARGGVSHYSREAAPPNGAAPRAPGALPGGTSAPPDAPPGLLPSTGSGTGGSPGTQPALKVIRHPVTRIWFYARNGPDNRQLGFITIPSPS